MSGTADEAELEPLVQPRLIRFLKNRPRIIDKGIRRELLQELELQAMERRHPDTAAEKAVENLMMRFNQAGGRVAKERAKKRLRNANKKQLRRL